MALHYHEPSHPPRHIRHARTAIFTVFATNGFGFASWMARIPHVRDALDLEPGELGRLLLALACGAVLALPTAGFVVGWLGAARTVAIGSLVAGSGLIISAFAADVIGSVAVTGIGLFALGYGTGSWDVAMNVEGAAVERLLDRHIMPRFHALFSLGTVVGAGLGAGLTWLGVSVAVHLTTIGAGVVVVTLLSTRHFLPARTPAERDATGPTISAWHAWREPRTLLIGVMVLCFALIEGIANDWLAVGLVDGYGVGNATGAAGFAIFVAAMTAGRLGGPWVLERYGRPAVIRASGMTSAAGVLMVVFGGTPVVAVAGVLLWGCGAALGFPVGMSAAADDPQRAAARVAVVSSIGYTAFLAGPPLLGWIGDHEGVLRALLVAGVAGVVGSAVGVAVRAARPSSTSAG
ncbi:MFS transporter [Actinobacteria bacterium YIM 96077]|uniref:MFS transporter n=1 Tax=Phytoactinopolyspora halophila TaxID=1981511 RepID=A0A329R099_9ACTN|nr:MFS transporter [Phytoactinopolyspora halophila]AYY11473.1 MFS transporter [Actinobacteria bacterium YIM 96077]RAW18044.1 MFS transporter [Phytoactinopolyspora halophila]